MIYHFSALSGLAAYGSKPRWRLGDGVEGRRPTCRTRSSGMKTEAEWKNQAPQWPIQARLAPRGRGWRGVHRCISLAWANAMNHDSRPGILCMVLMRSSDTNLCESTFGGALQQHSQESCNRRDDVESRFLLLTAWGLGRTAPPPPTYSHGGRVVHHFSRAFRGS